MFISGHDLEGFRHSDLKLLRLLLIAAARVNGRADRWIGKLRARDGDDKDRALEKLRQELTDVPGLSAAELRSIIRSQRGTDRTRLAVLPGNLTLQVQQSTLTSGVTPDQKAGAKNSTLALRDVQRLLHRP